MPSPRSYTVVLLLAIFAGFLGAHRFAVGKAGTGVLYLFTAGLFVIGWFVDIVTVAIGSFTDSQGRPVRRTPTLESLSTTAGQRFVPGPGEGLEYVAEGGSPEVDHEGRVVARLAAGSQFEIPVVWRETVNLDAVTEYFRPASNTAGDTSGTVTRRCRLVGDIGKYWGGQCFVVEIPDGTPAFEVRDSDDYTFGLVAQIVADALPVLRSLDAGLRDAAFVFDVSVEARFTLIDAWGVGDSEEPTDLELLEPTIRLRNPLGIQVLSAEPESSSDDG